MNLIERGLRALGKPFEFRLGQETVAKLDGPKVVEDHVVLSRTQSRASCENQARRKWEC